MFIGPSRRRDNKLWFLDGVLKGAHFGNCYGSRLASDAAGTSLDWGPRPFSCPRAAWAGCGLWVCAGARLGVRVIDLSCRIPTRLYHGSSRFSVVLRTWPDTPLLRQAMLCPAVIVGFPVLLLPGSSRLRCRQVRWLEAGCGRGPTGRGVLSLKVGGVRAGGESIRGREGAKGLGLGPMTA